MKKIVAKKRKPREENKGELLNYNNAIKIIVIIVLIATIKAVITSDKSSLVETKSKAELEEEAIGILKTITNENTQIGILDSNGIVEEKIENLNRMDYDDIKSLFKVKNDFCIFFEDTTGNIAHINGVTSGIGSGKIYVNGKPCR